jgi:hypothetical protein
MEHPNKTSELRKSAPKIFTELARFLDQTQLDQLAEQYFECDRLGGNLELGMVREEGVSFNPRLARILKLLVADGGVREYLVLRAALFAACLSEPVDLEHLPGAAILQLSDELKSLVLAVWSPDLSEPKAALIRGVIELDTLRHLHQTVFSQEERVKRIQALERLLNGRQGSVFSDWLRIKLEHAVVLQTRCCKLDAARGL